MVICMTLIRAQGLILYHRGYPELFNLLWHQDKLSLPLSFSNRGEIYLIIVQKVNYKRSKCKHIQLTPGNSSYIGIIFFFNQYRIIIRENCHITDNFNDNDLQTELAYNAKYRSGPIVVYQKSKSSFP